LSKQCTGGGFAGPAHLDAKLTFASAKQQQLEFLNTIILMNHAALQTRQQ
jgi:hypothetical protein